MSRPIGIPLAYLALEDSEFRMPVRKREQQSHDIWIPAEQFCLDRGNLPQAAFHSRRCSYTFCCDFFKGTAIAFERSLLARECLPARDYDVCILGI